MNNKELEVQCDEDGSTFVCIGTMDKRKALKAIRDFERDECGLDDEHLAKLDDLELTPIWKGINPDEGDEWTWWANPPSEYWISFDI